MSQAKVTVRALAERIGGQVRGDDSLEISGAAPAGEGKPGEISFATGPAQVARALEGQASCLIVGESSEAVDTGGVTVIVVKEPKQAFTDVLRMLHPDERPAPGIHVAAVIEDGVPLGRDVHVGAGAIVGRGAQLEDRVAICAGASVGADVRIGRDSILHPRSVVYPGAVLGERVIVHSGAVLGADGFGYVTRDGRHEKFPQVGTLVIGDDVEIGANSTIDRGALGPTTIGVGTKIDNLVQIGHNVQIGSHCFICALVGIGGSAEIGDGVILAGQVGVGDHATIESNVVVGGRGGVLPNKVVRSGQIVWGVPARPIRDAKRQQAALNRLPKLARTVAALARKAGLDGD